MINVFPSTIFDFFNSDHKKYRFIFERKNKIQSYLFKSRHLPVTHNQRALPLLGKIDFIDAPKDPWPPLRHGSGVVGVG